MAKMKTNRGAAKRFKVTANGKIKRSKAFGRHILTKKTTKVKRGYRKDSFVDASDAPRMKRLLPYS